MKEKRKVADEVVVHHIHHHLPLRHGWLKYFIKDFESNPAVQYRIHMTFTYVWLVNMLLAVAVFVFLPGIWQAVSVLYLVCISLYANFATDYGAVSAAIAAGTAEHSPPEDRNQVSGSE